MLVSFDVANLICSEFPEVCFRILPRLALVSGGLMDGLFLFVAVVC